MSEPDRQATGPHVAAQTSGSWVGLDQGMRGEALTAALENQDRAIRGAMAEMQVVKDFVGAPEHILGSPTTKHGEIAEQVHVGFRRAMDAVHQRTPSATFDGVPRTGRVDYVDGGVEIQSKYYNGLRNSLDGAASHASQNSNFATGDGQYHLARDQFEQLRELAETGGIEGLSARSVANIEELLRSLERQTGRSREDLFGPGKATYGEVQQGEVHKTIAGEEQRVGKADEERRVQAREEQGPSFAGAVEAAAIGAAAGAGVTLAAALWAKYREGKNPFRDGFSPEDWKDVGLRTATGAGTGALAGSGVYWLTNSTDLAAPFAGSLVSGLMGIGALLNERQQGTISDEEFVDLSVIAAADAAVVGIAAVAGQALIPVPVLGAFIGSVAGKLVASALKDSLGEAESELIERLGAYETAALEKLDDTLRALLVQLGAHFGRLEDLARIAFDERVNTELRMQASIRFAEAVDVHGDLIIRSQDDLDVFMQEQR